MSNSRRWKEFISWWRSVDSWEWKDVTILREEINNKIDEIQRRNKEEIKSNG